MISPAIVNEGPFEGWDIYPQNLSNSQDFGFAYDLEQYREKLSDHAKRIFIAQNKETTIKVTEFGKPCRQPESSNRTTLVMPNQRD
jgi:hypothetical protein